MTDYTIYQLNRKEYMYAVAAAGLIFFILGILFFKTIWIAFILALLGLFYPKLRSRELRERRKEALTSQFKQALYSLSSSLSAGKSVESAFKEALRDLHILYPHQDTYIIQEFMIIQRRMENGESIEKALYDFSQRAGIEDIISFTDVFVICKRSGGNLIEVMRNTANMMSEKLAVQQEIAVLIAQKKFESKVLTLVPILIIASLRYSSPDYMEPLYQGKGVLIMMMALFVLLICYFISRKIMEIKV